ncbi:hypothetical protein [Hyphococcus sp. DH-69]|uniref:hypothetical protein n=1 Tax=Hyphococcus formosus TaxID=3143534 RepID=UPI00398AA909
MKFRPLMIIALTALVTACASPQKGDRPRGGGPVSVNQPSTLLAKARDIQAKQGCARALPAYRVVSAYGAGYDVAQYELGACLFEVSGKSAQETELLRSEGLFWLRRAAWAGNPRAQFKLAEVLSGLKVFSDQAVPRDPVEAMMWVGVYEANGVRSVYSMPDISAAVVDHIRGNLTPAQMEEARVRAAEYRKIEMATFVPPQGARSQQSGRGQGERPEGQRRRRR